MKNLKAEDTPVRARMLSVKQAAQYLGATVWYVRNLDWSGTVKAVEFGNRKVFDIQDLDAYITRAKARIA